jgi:TRAP-type uncharacterized transport system fused permease subunit
MWVGSIIYFLPFFFVMNPALVLQGNGVWLEAAQLFVEASIGILFICGGLQGYQAGIGDTRHAGLLEWPIRLLLIAGGFVLAMPGGGISPVSQTMATAIGFGIIAPTALVLWLMVRRAGRPDYVVATARGGGGAAPAAGA